MSWNVQLQKICNKITTQTASHPSTSEIMKARKIS
jgi:hypothetical protein